MAWSTAAVGGLPLASAVPPESIDRAQLTKHCKLISRAIIQAKGAMPLGIGAIISRILFIHPQRPAGYPSHQPSARGVRLLSQFAGGLGTQGNSKDDPHRCQWGGVGWDCPVGQSVERGNRACERVILTYTYFRAVVLSIFCPLVNQFNSKCKNCFNASR